MDLPFRAENKLRRMTRRKINDILYKIMYLYFSILEGV